MEKQSKVAPASRSDLTESQVARVFATGDCACTRSTILISRCAQESMLACKPCPMPVLAQGVLPGALLVISPI